ncbi:MAG: molybdopterin-dependent oxidoreductase [Chloroflexota bacterium]
MSYFIKKMDYHSGMNRRTFLKASAFSGLVLFLNRSIKLPKLPIFSSAKVTEGVLSEEWVPTSCLNCATRCATHVRVVNGKAVRIEGNSLSKVSEGKICPRGHIGLQVLYDPSRVTTPLKRTNTEKGRGIDPAWTPISWNQAVSEVSTHLKMLREKGQPNGLLLFEGLNTISTQDMMHRFAQAYGTPNFISGDSLEKQAEIVGRWLADGNYKHIAYDMGQTNYILAFGAGILESEKPFARNLRMWGRYAGKDQIGQR